MALLVRLRQVIPRPSPIPHKCCSFFHTAPVHSSSRRENPNIRPTRSKHHPPTPTTTEELIESFFETLSMALVSVEDVKSLNELSDKFKSAGLEMAMRLKSNCRPQERSVEDAKVINEMSINLEKSAIEMIEHLKDMLGHSLISPDLCIDCKNRDKSEHGVITRRLPSPLTEKKNQFSVEDTKMIDEMPNMLTGYIKIIEKLKAMPGYASLLRDFQIRHKYWKKFAAKRGYASHPRVHDKNIKPKIIHNPFKIARDIHIQRQEMRAKGYRGPFCLDLSWTVRGDKVEYSSMEPWPPFGSFLTA